MKSLVLDMYGNRCRKCGFSDPRALHIDHVHGGGRAERKKLPPATLLRKIIKENAPSDYQLLCANCNCIKMYESNEFPGSRAYQETA